jgi:flagellar protein FlgJ
VPLDPKLPGLGAATGTRDASTWLDLQGLQQLKTGSEQRRPENVRAVAQQFEQVFLGMMLKSMRDAKLADSAMDGEGTQLYQDLYDKQVTLQMAQGRGLGIADLLFRQFAPDAVAKPASPGAAGEAAVAGLPGRPRASNPKFGAAAMARAYETVRGPLRADESTAAAAARAIRVGSAYAPTTSVAPPPVASELAGLPPLLPGGGPDAVGEFPVAARATPSSAVPVTAPAGPSRRFADSPEDFVRKVLPHAVAAAAELGVAPAAIVAQAALETGWGRHVPAGADGAGHNLFGIKAGAAWAGRQLGRATVEVANGLAVRTQAAFRAYDSVAAGFRDYVNLLRTSERYGGVRSAGEDPARFAHALQAGGYATDPHYARKLLQIVNGSTLREAMAAVGAEPAPARLALKTDAGPPIT